MKTLFISLSAALFLTVTLNAQIITTLSPEFKDTLVNLNCIDSDGDFSPDSDADTDNDGEISVVEAEALEFLWISANGIDDATGLEYFTNLNYLEFTGNPLTSIDVSALVNLQDLLLDGNQLTEMIGLNNLTNLGFLSLSDNLFTTLTISNLPNLSFLACGGSALTSLNLNNLDNLGDLYCTNSSITSLDISGALNIFEFHCNNNSQLTSLELNSTLSYLNLVNNGFSELDVSGAQSLSSFWCNNNPNLTFIKLGSSGAADTAGYYIENNPVLETISFKNGVGNYNDIEFGYYSICNNPSLTFVCADESEIENYTYEVWEGEWVTVTAEGVQQMVDDCGYTNVTVSSYCSFVPGGEYYTIEGSTHLDLDINGCTIDDAVLSNLIFSITDGTETGSFISNATGNYSIHLQEGSHTISPTIENPSYFTISPTEITVSFPTDTSPFLQDFCITPNGVFNDLEITIIPIEIARPGFDANYKVIYKNKGNTTLSGSVDLAFQDDVMDFVTSNPSNESGLPDLLSWNFSDLLPFEAREIDFTMNLNAPTDSPPLNDADVLEFIASITSTETDETPNDNTFIFNQTVVNSFDPNDKTCLEGAFVQLEDVGEYVHYMIRFENTGTADAINIVVKDEIDETKYDLTTLVPLHASHDYFAKIKSQGSDNYVEFIFENINLPFDDANNDGYIAFKLKTLDTLELGDTFENNAEIYFDYNFPIITNITQTTVGVLSVEEFELANNSVLLYPNPTTHIINLEAKNAINQVIIYDVFGRSIKEIAILGYKTQLNISTESLASGTYFVKVETASGEIVKKMIKE